MTTIRNGVAFPKAVKLAALKAAKAKRNSKRSVAAIAADFGVSPSTLSNWKRAAGLNKPQPTGLARHQAAQAAIQAYNTPTIVDYTTPSGSTAQCLELRGKRFY